MTAVPPPSSQHHEPVHRYVHSWFVFPILPLGLYLLLGCVPQTTSTSGELAAGNGTGVEQTLVDKAVTLPVTYENSAQRGPALVVLPGQFKITDPTFKQRFAPNNIADFAELELDRANFTVLERAHLGPLLDEVTLAVNMGDPQGLRNFRKGKFATTRWFLQFDVLRAEPVAEAGTSFDGQALGDLVTTLAGDSLGGKAAGSLIASTGGSDNTRIWIIGLRYKIIDAVKSEVVSTNYIEEKMEVGSSSAKFLGISHTEQGGMTIDSMVHRLVQKCVAEIDKAKGHPSALAAIPNPQNDFHPGGTSNQPLAIASSRSQESPQGAVPPAKNQAREMAIEASPNCQELRKSWQLGDASVMQRYLKECAK